jgi:hypothetical protein
LANLQISSHTCEGLMVKYIDGLITMSSKIHLKISYRQSSWTLLFFFFFFFFVYSVRTALLSYISVSTLCYRYSLCFWVPNIQLNILANTRLKYSEEVSLIAILSRCLILLLSTILSNAILMCWCYSSKGWRRTSPKYRQFTPNLWNILEIPLLSDKYLRWVVANAFISCGIHYFFRKLAIAISSYSCFAVVAALENVAPVSRFTLIVTFWNNLAYLLIRNILTN